ncbi:hypothetical protein [Arthrobacter sp. KNU40]|uniref:hypothetical protein n=1 Tax=Arthrobacter sp. KNU40 TaxID=3447965 RepID=UPI003F6483F7
MTNQRDLDEWRAVDKGGTPTWRTIIGTTEAPWLTPKGRKLVARITADLQRIVGDEWVGRAFERRETGVFALLARMSPALNPRGPATGMVDLAVFWLDITSTSDFPGHADVIKTIKSDLRPEAFGHGLTQFRIATLAHAAGYEPVALEQTLSRDPVDLVLNAVDKPVALEVYTPSLDEQTKLYEQVNRKNVEHLHLLAHRHGIHWTGDVPATSDDQLTKAWKARTERVAQKSAKNGVAVHITEPDGSTLTAAPGTAPIGTELNGPVLKVEVGHRLRNLVRKKTFQTTKSGANMLWIDDHGATGLLFEYEALPPEEKLNALVELFEPVLDDAPNIDALVFRRELHDIGFRTRDSVRVARDGSSFTVSQPYPGTLLQTAVLSSEGTMSKTIAERITADEPNLWRQALATATGLTDWSLMNAI